MCGNTAASNGIPLWSKICCRCFQKNIERAGPCPETFFSAVLIKPAASNQSGKYAIPGTGLAGACSKIVLPNTGTCGWTDASSYRYAAGRVAAAFPDHFPDIPCCIPPHLVRPAAMPGQDIGRFLPFSYPSFLAQLHRRRARRCAFFVDDRSRKLRNQCALRKTFSKKPFPVA
jgi:hypothetical protein